MKNSRTNPDLDVLFTRKEALNTKLAQAKNDEKLDTVNEIELEIEDTNEKISQICAKNNKKIVEDYLEHVSDGVDGFGHQKVWKMKKILAPKNTFETPTAKKDDQGNLITDLKNLENLYLNTYINRLRPNQVQPHPASPAAKRLSLPTSPSASKRKENSRLDIETFRKSVTIFKKQQGS